MLKTTIGVGGMACEMCEQHINEAIKKAFPDISKVSSSHSKNETIVLSNDKLPEDVVKNVIENTGYHFLSYKSEPYSDTGFLAHLMKFFGQRQA